MPRQPEYLVGLESLALQISDASIPAVDRIAAAIISRTYLEAVIANLVTEAREAGATWVEVARLFSTSEQNVKARFGSLHGDDD